MTFKTTLAALAIVTATPAAADEQFLLSTHGAWDVTYETFDGGSYCAMTTQNRRNNVFSLTAMPDGTIDTYWTISVNDNAEAMLQVAWDTGSLTNSKVRVDGDAWGVALADFAILDMGQAYFMAQGVRFEFLRDMAAGDVLTIERDLAAWSLAGSAAAARALGECRTRNMSDF